MFSTLTYFAGHIPNHGDIQIKSVAQIKYHENLLCTKLEQENKIEKLKHDKKHRT